MGNSRPIFNNYKILIIFQPLVIRLSDEELAKTRIDISKSHGILESTMQNHSGISRIQKLKGSKIQ